MYGQTCVVIYTLSYYIHVEY